MLRNKKTLYILLPAVVLIWGAVVHKIISGIDGDNNTGRRQNYVQKAPGPSYLPDTFSMSGNCRDPFRPEKVYQAPSGKNANVVNRGKTKNVRWPQVTYNGWMKNIKTGTVQVNLVIAGQDRILKPGEEKEGIALVRVWEDSVMLKYDNDIKSFMKEK
ncbi:MAG: hypothetical protein JXA03_10520 [Bacteroidales bacterium]|nr:hypothetical protein [Bacteroidales bacterium]